VGAAGKGTAWAIQAMGDSPRADTLGERFEDLHDDTRFLGIHDEVHP